MVITSLRLKSLLMPQDFLSMVRAFSHLCSIKWPGCHLSGPEKKLPCFWPTPRPHLSLVTTKSLAGLQNFNIHHSGYPNKLQSKPQIFRIVQKLIKTLKQNFAKFLSKICEIPGAYYLSLKSQAKKSVDLQKGVKSEKKFSTFDTKPTPNNQESLPNHHQTTKHAVQCSMPAPSFRV